MKIVVGNQVKKIPNYLFCAQTTNASSYCPNITSIVFENNGQCHTIGKYAFYYCYYLTSLELPNFVIEIQDYAFYNCSRLATLKLNQLETIGIRAFYNCSALREVLIPYSVATIQERAFGCDSSSNNKITFLCERFSKPQTWHSQWNVNSHPITWGYDQQEVQYYFSTNCELVYDAITTDTYITLPSLVRENYYLLGWYLEEDFSGERFSPNQRIYSKELGSDLSYIFYAKWGSESLGDANSLESAYPIERNCEMTVNIATAQQQKYYKFVPKYSDSYVFYANASSTVYCYVLDDNGAQLSYSSGTNPSVTVNLTKGKTYYLRTKFSSSTLTGNYIIGITKQ